MKPIQQYIAKFKRDKRVNAAEQREQLKFICLPQDGSDPESGWVKTDEQNIARATFIEKNMLLVVFFVLKFCKVDDDRFEDIVSAGTVGIIKALDNFDVTKETRFSTYANFWVQAFVYKELDSFNPSTYRHKTLAAAFKKAKKHAQKSGCYMTDDEVFDLLGWDEAQRLQHTWDSQRITIPLDSLSPTALSVIQEDGAIVEESNAEAHLFDMIKEEDINLLRKALSRISPMQAEIIRRHYGIDCPNETYDQLARHFGITREKVRQLENKGLRVLWRYLRKKIDMDDLLSTDEVRNFVEADGFDFCLARDLDETSFEDEDLRQLWADAKDSIVALKEHLEIN